MDGLIGILALLGGCDILALLLLGIMWVGSGILDKLDGYELGIKEREKNKQLEERLKELEE